MVGGAAVERDDDVGVLHVGVALKRVSCRAEDLNLTVADFALGGREGRGDVRFKRKILVQVPALVGFLGRGGRRVRAETLWVARAAAA